MILILALAVTNTSNLLINFLLPSILDPDQYVQLNINWTIAQFLAIIFFEWLRSSTLRFSKNHKKNTPDYQSDINYFYGLFYIIIISLILLSLLTKTQQWFTLFLFFIFSQSFFDFSQAYNRAYFKNLTFTKLATAKSILLLTLPLLSFYFLDSNSKTLFFAISLSSLIPVIFFSPNLISNLLNLNPKNSNNKIFIVRYGVPISITTIAAAFFPVLFKFFAEKNALSETSAAALFSFDISYKIISSAALALNIVCLQKIIKSYDTDSRALFIETLKEKTILSGFILFFFSFSSYYFIIYFSKYLISSKIEEQVTQLFFIYSASCLALALRAYLIDSLFVVLKKPAISWLGIIVSILSFTITSIIIKSTSYSADYLSTLPWILLSSSLLGFFASYFALTFLFHIDLPFIAFFKPFIIGLFSFTPIWHLAATYHIPAITAYVLSTALFLVMSITLYKNLGRRVIAIFQ